MFDTPQGAEAAFLRYEQIRHRLPTATFPAASIHLPSLAQTADMFDGYILDAFGVLNVGETAIPGAVARMTDLRALGKKLCVLTNAASYTRPQLLAKYHRLGFDFTHDEVVSSRDVAAARLQQVAPGARWAALGAAGDSFSDIPADLTDAIANPQAFEDADAFVFLSTARWNDALQTRLAQALAKRPRPLVIANPDLVAPREDGLSLEPGLFAHAILDALAVDAQWFGKPFAEGFTDAIDRINLPAHRLAMVGDTLHTDVLGGAAAGMGTILITDHGLFAGHDTAPFIARCGITPSVIVPTT